MSNKSAVNRLLMAHFKLHIQSFISGIIYLQDSDK